MLKALNDIPVDKKFAEIYVEITYDLSKLSNIGLIRPDYGQFFIMDNGKGTGTFIKVIKEYVALLQALVIYVENALRGCICGWYVQRTLQESNRRSYHRTGVL